MMRLVELMILAGLITAQVALAAPRSDDGDALRNVEQGKVLLNVNMTDANKMTLYLSVI